MSKLTKYALIWTMIAVSVHFMLPNTIGDAVIDRVLSVNSTGQVNVTGNFTSVMPSEPSGVGVSSSGYLGVVTMAWQGVGFIIDILSLPLNLWNFMVASGAPSSLSALVVLPFIIMILLAVVDWVRGGT